MGGGITSVDSESILTVNNSIIARNIASRGTPDVCTYTETFGGSHNLIGDGTGQTALVDGENGNLVGTSEAPLDPMLDEWSDFGNSGWYYPLAESPALDAGENALAVDGNGQPLDEDVRGAVRVLNGTVDLGSVEGTLGSSPAQTYVVTSLADAIDATDGELTFVEALEAANSNRTVGDAPGGSWGQVDVIRFAEGLTGTFLLDGGSFEIEGDLAIEGPGAELLTFDGDGASGVSSFPTASPSP